MAIVLSSIALILSIFSLIISLRGRRRGRKALGGPTEADELLHAAWIDEIEKEGEKWLQRLAEVEARLAQRERTSSGNSQSETAADAFRGHGNGATLGPQSDSSDVQFAASSERDESTPGETLADAVRRKASEGDDPATIARSLDVGLGVVEFILSLGNDDGVA